MQEPRQPRPSRLRTLASGGALILFLGASTPGCPIVDALFAIWFGGPTLEFALSCARADIDDVYDAIDYCDTLAPDEFMSCMASCSLVYEEFSPNAKNAQNGDELFWTENNFRVLHASPNTALPAGAVEVIDYGRIPAGVALDLTGGHAYWTDFRANAIYRATLGGTSLETLPLTGLGATGLAFENATGMLWWTTGPAGSIQKGNPNGTGIATVLSGLPGPGDIALDETAGKVYWADFHTTGTDIKRANLDGSSIETIHTSTGALLNITLELSGGKVYWSDATNDAIRRANLDGTSVETIVTVASGPTALAVDAGASKIYWSDAATLDIRTANLDGSSATTIKGFSPAGDLALDLANGHIFFSGLMDGRMKRMNLDGTGEISLSIPFGLTAEIAVDESRSKVYWLKQTGELIRGNFDGTSVDTIATAIAATSLAFDTATDKLYWSASSNIMRSDPDGGNVETLVSGLTFLTEVAVDGAAGYIYWINQTQIGRANLDGTGAGTLVTESSFARDLAARGGLLYWTITDKVRSIPANGPFVVTDIHTGLESPFFVSVTDNFIYWHLAFSNDIQRSALDGTGLETVAAGNRISSFVVAGTPTLPVELVDFHTVVHDGSAILRWRTASEQDVSGFEVQQQLHGEALNSWTVLGFEPARGGESTETTYSLATDVLEPGDYRFRLRMIDTDGSFEYSPIVNLFIPDVAPIRLTLPYPNPFKESATFTFSARRHHDAQVEASDGVHTVEVFDVLGRRVREMYRGNSEQSRRSIELTLDGSGLSAGTYFIVARSENGHSVTQRAVYVGAN